MVFSTRGALAALTLLGLTTLPQVAHAQTERFYITAGDQNDRLTIVQGGVLISTTNLNVANQLLYPIAVRNTVWLGDRGVNGGSTELDLNGVPTGNTSAYGPGNDQLLDGTTNGTSNFAAQFSGGSNVIQAGLDWSGQSILFDVPNNEEGQGITFDTASGNLFVSTFSGRTYEMTLGGTIVNTLAVGIRSLAYEQSTDTLWGVSGSNQIHQYNKSTGAVLQTLTIAGAAFGNAFGGEMRLNFSSSSTAPEPGTLALLALGMAGGVVARRRRK